MFLKLFQALKLSGIPVSIKEYLDMLNGLEKGICNRNSVDEFYHFSKISLIKDEKYFDKFDKVFKNFYELNNEFYSVINNFIKLKWVNEKSNSYVLTMEGRLRADYIASELFK